MSKSVDLIKKYFDYLTDEYGFSIHAEMYSPDIMGNAAVLFVSETTKIQIVVDRSQVLLKIGKSSWPEKDLFDFTDVISYFNSDLIVYKFQKGSKTYPENIELQLQNVSLLLIKYCKSLIRGDFSMEEDIRDIEKKRVAKMLEHFQGLSERSKGLKE